MGLDIYLYTLIGIKGPKSLIMKDIKVDVPCGECGNPCKKTETRMTFQSFVDTDADFGDSPSIRSYNLFHDAQEDQYYLALEYSQSKSHRSPGKHSISIDFRDLEHHIKDMKSDLEPFGCGTIHLEFTHIW